MGESSACLLRSFSQPSHTSSDYRREDYLTALTTSISFGRFATETLDWEKRSAFTQNRNLEEVQNLSKLGTVAQKKAYFEAHYKRIAAKKKEEAAAAAAAVAVAAELLDLGPQPPDLSPQPTSHSSLKSKQNSPAAVDEMQEHQTTRTGLISPINVNEDTHEVEVSNTSHHENTKMPDDEKTPVKLEHVSKKGDLSKFSKKKKPIVSSSKQSAVKPTNSYSKKKDDNASDSLHKKTINSTPKSLHMSMNFGSLASGETYKPYSPMLSSLKNSRIVKTLVNASKESWMQRTPIRASVSGVPKHSYLRPQSEDKGIETPLHRPVCRTKAVEGKPPSLPKERLESSRAFCATKSKSTTVSSTFCFKSEERAAKRKEFFRKLDENAKEAEKARPLTKSKIPLTRACSPKHGRKANVQDITSPPPWKSSAKNDSIDRSKSNTEMNKRVTIHSVNNKLHKRSTRENTSPNIPILID